MTRRDATALAGAVCMTLGAVWLIYFFFSRYWSVWPPWVTVPICIIGAVVAIGSPIHTLLRISDRMLERQSRERAETDETSGGKRS